MKLIVVVGALVLGASTAVAAGRGSEGDILTVRASQAELRGRPSLDSTVMGLVRRGETVERLRSSSDGRWIEVDIGGGELAWIDARAVKAEDERRYDDDDRRRIDRRREEDLSSPPRRVREEPREMQREVRNDPPRRVDPPRVASNHPPPRRVDPPRVAHNDPPPQPVVKREPPPQPVVKQEPTPGPQLRDIPPAKPGEVFAAYLDDERPPSGPTDTKKHK